MDKKYRILLVHNRYRYAGGEDTLEINEARLLEKHGHTVISYIKDSRDMDKYTGMKKLTVALGLIRSPRVEKELAELIRKEKIDLIYVINLVPLIGFSVYRLAFRLRIPIVSTVNNFRYLCPGSSLVRDGHICEECLFHKSIIPGLGCTLMPALKNGCYRNSRLQTAALSLALAVHRFIGTFDMVSRYTVPSEFNKSRLELLVKDKTRVVAVPPSVPDTIIRKEKVASGVDIPENFGIIPAAERKYYIYAARLEQLKGIQVAIEAFSKLPYTLKVLGTGADEEKMKKLVCERQLDNIEFLGFKNLDEMRRLIGEAKALIFPTQWYEGVPLTLLESFALGTPVIGSDIGNVGNCIIEGVNGYHFEYNIAKALSDVVNSFEKKMSDNIYMTTRKTYEANYTEDAYYERLMKVFEEAMQLSYKEK